VLGASLPPLPPSFVPDGSSFLHTRLLSDQSQQLSDYFVCEGSRSKQPDLDCNVQGLVARQFPAVATIIQVVTAIVQGFIPTFFLTLFVDFTKLKAQIVHCYSNH